MPGSVLRWWISACDRNYWKTLFLLEEPQETSCRAAALRSGKFSFHHYLALSDETMTKTSKGLYRWHKKYEALHIGISLVKPEADSGIYTYR